MRVAAFYFFYLATTGISLPYFTKYLKALGYSGFEIASIASISPLLSIFVPLVWGFAADRSGKLVPLLKIAVAGTACALLPLIFVQSYAGILSVWVGYAFFTSAIATLADTLAVIEARRIGTDYARLRLWGSISFIATSFGFGQYLSAGGSIKHVPAVMFFLALLAAVVVHILRAPAQPLHKTPPSFKEARALAANPALLWFFAAGMIHQAGLSPYYIFYAIHLEAQGMGQDVVGWSFGLGVAAEVLMLYAFRHVFKRVPLFPMMAASFLISSARWFLVARLHSAPLMAVLQTAHAFTFAFCYAGAIAHLEKNVAEPLRATGRALFSAISLGLGSVLGHWLAGTIFDARGSSAAFNAAALLDLVAVIPLLISAKYVKNALAETSEIQNDECLSDE